MKVLYVIIFCLSGFKAVYTQEVVRVYSWDKVFNANPDTVYGIELSGRKLETLPEELKKFTNLKVLDVSRNKLTQLPEFIEDYGSLEQLDISRNKLEIFPLVITRVKTLKSLKANRNDFDRLPDAIRYNTQLEYIDFWDTPVSGFPDGFFTLSKLKKVDLSGIRFGPTFQRSLSERMPWVEFVMDEPCDCME